MCKLNQTNSDRKRFMLCFKPKKCIDNESGVSEVKTYQNRERKWGKMRKREKENMSYKTLLERDKKIN